MRASDPTTPADELREVAKLHTPEALRALGENPASPLDLLLHLAAWVPGRVLGNDALKLHTLSLGPGLLDKAPEDSVYALLRHPEGAWLISLAIGCHNHANLRLVAEHCPLSVEEFNRLLQHGLALGLSAFHWVGGLARRADLPLQAAEQLAQSVVFRRDLAANPSLPPAIQRRLLQQSSPLAETLLGNLSLDPAIASELLGSEESRVRGLAAACSRLPLDDLLRCARHEEHAMRAAAARNPALPVEALLELARDPVEMVRREAARSTRLPEGFFDLLSLDPSVWVRCTVASNPVTPVDALALLAEDPDEFVRASAATNPRTPVYALEALSQPPDTPLFELLSNPSLPPEIARELVRRALAMTEDEVDADHQLSELLASPVLPPERVGELLQRTGLKGSVPLPPMTPAPLLAELAEGPRNVRRLVIQCEGTPDGLLRKLAWDQDSMVARAAREALRRRGQGLDE